MIFKISCRFTAKVLFESEAETMKAAVEIAVSKRANLRDADLRGADLRGANLRDADLSDADMGGANLRGANLRGANLRGADLRGADLRDADMGGANLRDANLRGADLSGADLRDADMGDIKADYLKVLSIAKHEVPGLYKALLEGKIDGSTYTGECACLVGTIANVRHEKHEKLGIDLSPDASRPAEKWFLNIRKGDTPENNQVSAIVKEWTEAFAAENGINLPKMSIVWSDA